MTDSLRHWFEELEVAVALEEQAGLRLLPSADGSLILGGTVQFSVEGPDGEVIEDRYEILLDIPQRFPDAPAWVRETGGRIPEWFHKLKGDYLCLGAPTAVRYCLTQSPTLPTLLRCFVIPYLFGYSFFLKNERMPFGELAHGNAGIREHLREMFGVRTGEAPEEFLRLTSLRRRVGNKVVCPCGSGLNLGRCHNRTVNRLRAELGRLWFREEYERVVRILASDKSAVTECFDQEGVRIQRS
jgi:hypothetical protein